MKVLLPNHWCIAISRWLGLLLLLLFLPFAVAQPVEIYPNPESKGDARASYPLAVLKLCAGSSKNGFVLKPSEFHGQQGRNIRQLIKGDGLDVIWAVPNAEREKLLLPIRIPIDRGLIGWRLLLIRDQDADLFSAISRREQLAVLSAGQGHDWPDVDVLRANHFKVEISTSYEGLFQMLALGHIQYFPRSVSEIWAELDAHPELGVQAQRSLVVHYPQALYFFVNRNNTDLARALTTCLVAATTDGSLKALFDEYYHVAIVRSDLRSRTVIELENPLMKKAEALLSDGFWFSPAEVR